jgi:N-methylhydantoinase A
MTYRVGVDIGGTFTDFVLVDDGSSTLALHKQLTTPRDPAIAVLEGLAKLLQKARVPVGQLSSIIHGSTLVTNAVIERRGAPTGMLVTKGFSDAIDIAMERRYDLYDLRIRFPAPMVSRANRMELDERIRWDGSIRRPVDLDEAELAAARLIERGITTVAVCLLHSFTNAEHERAVAERLRTKFPKLYISTSSDVFPFAREYERWTTTIMNAYTQPLFDGYLANLESGLARLSFGGDFFIMTSSGGMVTPETARRYPVRMLESGPAAGVLMSARHGRTLGLQNLLSFDMGGTTAKGSIVEGGEPRKVYEIEVARLHEFRPGSGLPAKIPVLDMIEIGSGGGSIATIDERSVIRVGPSSAGADPGPACYGRGGLNPTLTDANLALGYLDPNFFLGGAMKLDRDAALKAIDTQIAKRLGLETVRAAWGIHDIVNEDVARAFRVHASELGTDYRTCSMVAFGGSGPAHALRIARKLHIQRVIFPVAAGVMSALGMLASPLSFQSVRSRRILHRDLDYAAFATQFAQIEDEASGFLQRAKLAPANIRIKRSVDARYQGQGYEIEVNLPDGELSSSLLKSIPALFARKYDEVFGISYLEAPIEIVNWKVEAIGPDPFLAERLVITGTDSSAVALKGHRDAYLPEQGRFMPCAVYDRYALEPGSSLHGPAMIEERESTIVVGANDKVFVDAFGNIIAELTDAGDYKP